MSAEILRRAASLMRERAEAAAIMAPPPWWSEGVWFHHFPVVGGEPDEVEAHPWPAVGYGNTGADVVGHNVRVELSDHIAGMHPAVALAVANWLETEADRFAERMERQADPQRRATGVWLAATTARHEHALAVARAYLGEST